MLLQMPDPSLFELLSFDFAQKTHLIVLPAKSPFYRGNANKNNPTAHETPEIEWSDMCNEAIFQEFGGCQNEDMGLRFS